MEREREGDPQDRGPEPRRRTGFHEPVLVVQVLAHLAREGPGWIVDGTVGGGGHARALLEDCSECQLLGSDRDPQAVEVAGRVLEPYRDRVRLVRARFDELPERVDLEGLDVRGVLLDLGVSSWQLDREERGFTFRPGAPLDMRMEGGEGGSRSAADILNEEDLETLTEIFRVYGEESRARPLARRITARRSDRPFRRSDDLLEVLAATLGRDPRPKDRARIFQALRIAANDELRALEAGLPRLRDALVPDGTFVVISYHSLEDRIVKNAFREWSRTCVCPPGFPVCRCRGRALGTVLTRKPVFPSEEEVGRNPRSRSARLRAWRKSA